MSQIPDPAAKIFTKLEDAVCWRNSVKQQGYSVALTNGCFDLLHLGHARYLMEARSLGDKLIVLLNSDESVRELKGPSRPVNPEFDRAFLLASFSFVDAVLIFNSKRCNQEINALRPDFYAKGGDYTLETLDPGERTALLAGNTKVHFIKFVPGRSTTNLIMSITVKK